MAQEAYCDHCGKMTRFICETCEQEPDPATKAMLELARRIKNAPWTPYKDAVASANFLAEWKENT